MLQLCSFHQKQQLLTSYAWIDEHRSNMAGCSSWCNRSLLLKQNSYPQVSELFCLLLCQWSITVCWSLAILYRPIEVRSFITVWNHPAVWHRHNGLTKATLTLWRKLLPHGYSYKAYCAWPGWTVSVIFDIRALWRQSVRVPGCQKLQMSALPGLAQDAL